MRHLHDERHFAESHIPGSRESRTVSRKLTKCKETRIVIYLPFAHAICEFVIPIIETRHRFSRKINIDLFANILPDKYESENLRREKVGHLFCGGTAAF